MKNFLQCSYHVLAIMTWFTSCGHVIIIIVTRNVCCKMFLNKQTKRQGSVSNPPPPKGKKKIFRDGRTFSKKGKQIMSPPELVQLSGELKRQEYLPQNHLQD